MGLFKSYWGTHYSTPLSIFRDTENTMSAQTVLNFWLDKHPDLIDFILSIESMEDLSSEDLRLLMLMGARVGILQITDSEMLQNKSMDNKKYSSLLEYGVAGTRRMSLDLIQNCYIIAMDLSVPGCWKGSTTRTRAKELVAMWKMRHPEMYEAEELNTEELLKPSEIMEVTTGNERWLTEWLEIVLTWRARCFDRDMNLGWDFDFNTLPPEKKWINDFSKCEPWQFAHMANIALFLEIEIAHQNGILQVTRPSLNDFLDYYIPAVGPQIRSYPLESKEVSELFLAHQAVIAEDGFEYTKSRMSAGWGDTTWESLRFN